MKTISLSSLSLLLAALVCQPLLAAPRELSVRAITMSNDFPSTKEVYLHNPGSNQEGQKVQIKHFLNHESDKAELEPGSFVVTSEETPSSAENEEAILATLNADAAITSCILLFLPSETPGSGEILLIEDAKKTFPPGAIQVVNTTDATLKLEIETKTIELNPGSKVIITDQPVGESNASSIKAYTKTDDGWDLFSSTSWPHPGTRRAIQIITDGRTGKPEMRGVKDISTPR